MIEEGEKLAPGLSGGEVARAGLPAILHPQDMLRKRRLQREGKLGGPVR
jgi:hypothetical protein